MIFADAAGKMNYNCRNEKEARIVIILYGPAISCSESVTFTHFILHTSLKLTPQIFFRLHFFTSGGNFHP